MTVFYLALSDLFHFSFLEHWKRKGL